MSTNETTNILKSVTIQQESDKTKTITLQPASGSTTGTGITVTGTVTANRTITIPDFTTTLVGTDSAQAISGKLSIAVDNLLLDGNTISSTNTNGDIVLDPHGTGVVDVSGAKISNIGTPTLANDAVTKTYADGISVGSNFNDDTFRIRDNVDNTKQLAFQLSGISTATTRTITMPDADVDLSTVGSSEFSDNVFRVFDNSDPTKKIAFDASQITTTATRVFTFPDADVEVVGHNVLQTISNKNLIDGSTLFINISDNSKNFRFNAGSLTPGPIRSYTTPDADTTIVGTDVTQDLSNKTFLDEVTLAQIATPSNPSSGFNSFYPKSDNQFYNLDSSGNERVFGVPTGTILDTGGRSAASGYFLTDGSAKSRTTYVDLYNYLCPVVGTFTVTIATPAVFTLTGHDLNTGELVRLFTTGALPTGLVANTDYWVNVIDANTFRVSTSIPNLIAGTYVNTSGSQSGTHTLQWFGWGAGDGSTTFNVPDLRGRLTAGRDGMGGSQASRITNTVSPTGLAVGAVGGTQTHTLTDQEIPKHSHTYDQKSNNAGLAGADTGLTGASSNTFGTFQQTTNEQGIGDGAHNNVQPTAIVNKMIKY